MRVVSLLPSATEIVYALGLDDQLVGVTFECDEPPTARRDKAIVVGGQDTRGMAPAEIDAYVKDRLAAGGDLYTLHADALAGLDPEMAPKIVQPPTMVRPRLPRTPPRIDSTQLTSRPEIPPSVMIAPARMKNGTAIRL